MIKASGGDVVAELLTPRFLGAEATDISLNKILLNHCLRFAPSSQFAVCGSFFDTQKSVSVAAEFLLIIWFHADSFIEFISHFSLSTQKFSLGSMTISKVVLNDLFLLPKNGAAMVIYT